jgi:MFS family permease
MGMERTATAWLALSSADLGNGAFAVGLALAARMLPLLLFGLAAGTIADRVQRARLLCLVAAVGVSLMAFFAWLTGSHAVQVWQVVAVSFCAGCLQVFETPARQSLALSTVQREVAPSAIALLALAGRLVTATGAFTAGLLIASSGLASCYVAIAAAWAVAGVLVLAVGARPAPLRPRTRPAFAHALRDAARLVLDNPAVRTLTIASVACEVFAFSHMSAVPVFARDVLQVGAASFGTLNASASLGGTLAVLGLLAVPPRVRREPLLGAVFVVYGVSLLALGSTRELVLTASVLVVTGACAAAFDVLQQTLIQLAVPEDQRGRAVGVWMVGIGSAPLGHVEMGTLAGALGAPSALLINGSLVVLASAALALRAPTYRFLPAGAVRKFHVGPAHARVPPGGS